MRYTRLATLALPALLLAAAPGLSAETASPDVTVITGFANPESVLIAGDRRYVSNLGAALEPLAKDGDGFISLVSADGRLLERKAFPPADESLDSPKGMALVGGRLYVADIDRVVGFSLESGARVFEAALPADGPALANDLAVLDETSLLLSDTLRDRLYRVDLTDGAVSLYAEGLPGANGIAMDPAGRRIYVVGVGAGFGGGDLFLLQEGAAPQRIEGGPHGILDGIALLPDGRLLISDWVDFARPAPGLLWQLPTSGGAAEPLVPGREIRSPADFAVDSRSDSLWIPSMLDGTVVILPLKRD